MAKTIRIAPPEAEASSPAALEKAERLVATTIADRYKIEAVIVATETGAVYRAAHVHLRKRVALKVVDAGAPGAEIARLEREAVAGAHVRHANVAGATDTGVLADGSRYLAIEHVAGASLREVLRNGPLKVERALRIARQLAGALSASHQQGIIHRNVEPRNVMLTGERGDDVRLLDFGRAKLDVSRFGNAPSAAPDEDVTSNTRVLTSTGIIEWTTAYLPPEAMLGSAVLDERADLYSLGVVLFEMVAGKRPFDAESPSELFAEQRDHAPPRVRQRAPGVVVPDALEPILARLLAVERTARYPTAAALAEALDAIKLGAPGKEVAKARAVVAAPVAASTSARLARLAGDVWAEVAYRSRNVLRLPGARPALAALGACALGLLLWMAFANDPKKPSRRAADEEVEPARAPRRAEPPSASASTSGSSAPLAMSGAARTADVMDGRDASGWRNELTTAVASENWARAGEAMLALVKAEPGAFKERGVAASAVSTAVALESAGGKQADAVFGALGSRLGSDGLWLLFEIVRTKGGTRGSERAARMLADPEIDKRAPAALRISLLVVTAPCSEKRLLFQRAADEGDERTLTALRALREMDDCPRRRPNPCCFKHDKQLNEAIERLASRLTKP